MTVRWRRLAGVVGLCGAWLAAPANAGAAPRRYDGHAIVRADVPDAAQLEQLQAAGAVVLDDRPGPGLVHLRVPPATQAALRASGVAFQTLVADVQPGLDGERARLGRAGPVSHGASFFADFRPLTDIEAHLDELVAERPDIASAVQIGLSLEGRPIRGISIGGGGPAVLLTGTIHAREWLSTMTVTCLADALVRGHGVDPSITAAIDAVQVIVIPVVNPDGYVHTWNADRYWRKNRRDGIGVDLNRNFPYQWGGEGSSGIADEENYRGTGPLSEPESAALADFITNHKSLVAHVDYHTFGQLLLYPWSYTYDPAPDDAALAALASAQVDAIAAVHGTVFEPLAGADLYPAAGVVDDWAYGELGLMAFAPELRPSFDGPGDFAVDPTQIVPSCEENLAAVLVLTDWAVDGVDEPGTTGTDTTGAEPQDSGDTSATNSGPTSTSSSGNADSTAGTAPTADGMPATNGDGTQGDGTQGGSAGAAQDGGGCGCTTGPKAPTGLVLLVGGLLATRRRKPSVPGRHGM